MHKHTSEKPSETTGLARRARLVALSLLGLALAGGAARAQSEPQPAPTASLPLHFGDWVDGTTGGRFSLATATNKSDGSIGDVVAFRLAGFYQRFAPSGVGFYAGLPAGFAVAEDGEPSSVVGFGNVDLGAAFARRDKDVGLVLRGGLTVPSASSGEDALANIFGGFSRIVDFALVYPDVIFARLSASGTLQSGDFFARADVGVDAQLHHSEGDDLGEFVHLALGAGKYLSNGTTSISAELATNRLLDSSLLTMAVGLGFGPGNQVSLFRTSLEDDDSTYWGLSVSFGLGGESKRAGPPAPRASATQPGGPRPQGDCAAPIEAWRSERDLGRKSALYDELPTRCRELLAHPAPGPAPQAAPAPSPAAASVPTSEPAVSADPEAAEAPAPAAEPPPAVEPEDAAPTTPAAP